MHKKEFPIFKIRLGKGFDILVTVFLPVQILAMLDWWFWDSDFITDSGEHEPWMSIALSIKAFFFDRFRGYNQKIYNRLYTEKCGDMLNLDFWIVEKDNRDKDMRGKI